MINDFEFIRQGNVVYKTRQDMGICPSAIDKLTLMFATMALDFSVKAGSTPKEAQEWDSVRVGRLTYSREGFGL